MSTMNTETYDALCQIGEIAGILQDIAAREISESKPIAGTAIDMLADVIGDYVEFGMNGLSPIAAATAPVSEHPEPSEHAATDQHGYIANRDATWLGGLDLRNLHAALSGAVTCLCGLQFVADGSEIEPEAFEPLLAVLTPWRDRVAAARDTLEAE